MKYIYEDRTDTEESRDVEKIVMAFRDKGHTLSFNDAHCAWNDYSMSMCAGWMFVPKRDEDIINIAKMYLSTESTSNPVIRGK